LTADEKKAVFEAGHKRQIDAWLNIAVFKLGKPKEVKAAIWALDALKKIAMQASNTPAHGINESVAI
jgi:hypothetical protein